MAAVIFRTCGRSLNCSVAVDTVECVSGKSWMRDVRSRGGGLADRDLGAADLTRALKSRAVAAAKAS
jgi:hypothetical protein